MTTSIGQVSSQAHKIALIKEAASSLTCTLLQTTHSSHQKSSLRPRCITPTSPRLATSAWTFSSHSTLQPSQLERLVLCTCVRASVCVCVCVLISVPTTSTTWSNAAFSSVIFFFFFVVDVENCLCCFFLVLCFWLDAAAPQHSVAADRSKHTRPTQA